jgi:8-oxo-dGTP pyrophosphatase MutT (NUDIX family)
VCPPPRPADAGSLPEKASLPPGAGGEFAVLVAILDHGGQECILLTKRPDSLPQYSGQVCFPGGARDPLDLDLAATAVREAGEEVGIGPERIKLLCELPQQATALGHRVKPFLARVAPGPIVPNPLEVERVLYVPLSHLKADPFKLRAFAAGRGKPRSTYTFQFEGCEVWGLTARILREHFV